ncbi:MAG: hypothetical protein LBR34_12000 [Prevotella sp.]|jgi:hypothetical protein|nr:hypothetical protein [Prevotella sp.]
METKVIATIDVSRPAGRKLVRELESKRCVELDYPLPQELAEAIADGRACTHEDFWLPLLDRLSEHYGTNMRKLIKL